METYSIENHQHKCRFCFKTLNKRGKHVQISEDIENKFYSITQIYLKSSSNYSNQICVNCDKELESFEQFKKDLVERQLKLYDFYPDNNEDPIVKLEIPEILKLETHDLPQIETVQIKLEVETEEDYEVPPTTPFHDDSYFDFKIPLPIKKKREKGKKALTKTERNKINCLKTVGLCPECGKYVFGVKRHMRRTHSKVINFICDLCDYSCLEKPQFLNHIKNKHQPKELRERFQCRFCDFTSFNRGYLRGVHEKTHSGKNFHCECCDKSFATKHILAQHISNVHDKLLKFKCQFCPKGYDNKVKLREHVLTQHTKKDVRDKICDICSRAFITEHQLTCHKKEVHTEGAISCDFAGCTKRFHKISKRDRHMRVHTKEKKFSCDKCGISYGYASQLYRHVESIHQGLRFYCEVPGCGIGFCRRENVRLHFGKSHPFLETSQLEKLLRQLKDSKPR